MIVTRWHPDAISDRRVGPLAEHRALLPRARSSRDQEVVFVNARLAAVDQFIELRGLARRRPQLS
ncbi:hypothetical protein GPL17_26980 [Bradyrhizobium yuanmingense]|uniref:hypothetical protein n=1 Tax=Bradyrhizobium yuanmingense TaxID=108015 RepID=UPI0012FBE0F3|nr:hypothetical protein [Bradyrhizobium yuanmingense]MVT54114.1 hypothetical protein [Bradyrhizobium yuanmingense]